MFIVFVLGYKSHFLRVDAFAVVVLARLCLILLDFSQNNSSISFLGTFRERRANAPRHRITSIIIIIIIQKYLLLIATDRGFAHARALPNHRSRSNVDADWERPLARSRLTGRGARPRPAPGNLYANQSARWLF